MGAHIINGEFQSDKYPTTPPGKVPLSVKDPTAQDLLWEYAQRRRSVDAEFSADLETCLKAAEYSVAPRERGSDFVPEWSKYPKLAAMFENRPEENVYWIEFRDFIRAARADAVRFVQDVKAEELRRSADDTAKRIAKGVRDRYGDQAHTIADAIERGDWK